MKAKRTFVSLTAIVLACAAFFWLAASHGVEKTVEVHTLPEYRTDTARAIDAYQQMINRLLDDNDRNRFAMHNQMNTIITKLDKIQADLDSLSNRIAAIETKMGIETTPCAKPCAETDKENCPKISCPLKSADSEKPADKPQ